VPIQKILPKLAKIGQKTQNLVPAKIYWKKLKILLVWPKMDLPQHWHSNKGLQLLYRPLC